MDCFGYGMVIISIVCGNGSVVDGDEFCGVVYEVMIISVKVM